MHAEPESSAVNQIVGQTADLVDLQRILQRSKKKLNDSQQQNITVGPFPITISLA